MNKAAAATDLAYAPPSFATADGKRVVFIDFQHANYEIVFDIPARTAFAKSIIRFRSEEDGHPAFDLRPTPSRVQINGAASSITRVSSPDDAARFVRLDEALPAGEHELLIEHEIPDNGQVTGEGVRWYNTGKVACVFTMTDLSVDGGFLERYLPSNFEYDHFAMKFDVRIEGDNLAHRLLTNIPTSGADRWSFELPDHFTTSCVWFHLVPESDVRIEEETYTSLDGRTLPMRVYVPLQRGWRSLLSSFVSETRRALGELETTYGPFPHPAVTVYGAGRGGMEYSGATRTSLSALEHELNHSYFARNITPSGGNAGWIDEAIASWGDANNPSSSRLPGTTDNLGNRSPYRRTTHRSSYEQGSQLIAYLNHRCQSVGGMRAVLREYFARKQRQSVKAEEFQAIVEDVANINFQDLFDRFVYGGGLNAVAAERKETPVPNERDPHIHSLAELASELYRGEDDEIDCDDS